MCVRRWRGSTRRPTARVRRACIAHTAQHWAGILCEYLSHDAATVRFLLGDFVIVMTLALGCVVIGLIISLYSCYPLSLVIVGCIPIILASGKLTRAVSLWHCPH